MHILYTIMIPSRKKKSHNSPVNRESPAYLLDTTSTPFDLIRCPNNVREITIKLIAV